MVKPFVKTKKLTGKDADKAISLIKKNTLSSSQGQKIYNIASSIIRLQYKKTASAA